MSDANPTQTVAKVGKAVGKASHMPAYGRETER